MRNDILDIATYIAIGGTVQVLVFKVFGKTIKTIPVPYNGLCMAFLLIAFSCMFAIFLIYCEYHCPETEKENQ